MLASLCAAFPQFAHGGCRALAGGPALYLSPLAHHSFVKAARFCGLGTDAVREVPVDARYRIDVAALHDRIERDRRSGDLPFLVVATAGSTSAGSIDPLPELAELAALEGIWLHVDAAWGGHAVLAPELAHALAGIERADSITFDAHKQLSVPMAAGLFLTRHRTILARACAIATDYMPKEAAGLEVVDPYSHSLQWSRRFIGLKVLLSLAVAGWEGYAELARSQARLADRLRERLRASDWRIVNDTPLPIVCFADAGIRGSSSEVDPEAIAAAVVASGAAWISTVTLPGGVRALRACVTNFRTAETDVDALVAAVDRARAGE